MKKTTIEKNKTIINTVKTLNRLGAKTTTKKIKWYLTKGNKK